MKLKEVSQHALKDHSPYFFLSHSETHTTEYFKKETKMKHSMKLVALTVATLLATNAQAGVVGTQSDGSYIKVGSSMWIPFGPHQDPAGLPGIGIKGVGLGQWGKISMNSVKRLAESNPAYGGTDVQNVTHVEPPAHAGRDKMGVFDFQKIATDSAEVYFGEWQAKNDGVVNPDTRSVYYVGKDKTTNMPTSGTATYEVKGINQYAQNGLLTGTLTANYGANTLSGSLNNSAMTLGINANINPANASFNGSANVGAVTGSSQGHFFGNQAAALAGIATFQNRRDLDTAFGGTKQ